MNFIFLACNAVAQAGSGYTPVGPADLQQLGMVTCDSSRGSAFRQPFGYQPLRKFALRVFICIDGPTVAVVQLALKCSFVLRSSAFASSPAMVKPKTCPDRQRAP